MEIPHFLRIYRHWPFQVVITRQQNIEWKSSLCRTDLVKKEEGKYHIYSCLHLSPLTFSSTMAEHWMGSKGEQKLIPPILCIDCYWPFQRNIEWKSSLCIAGLVNNEDGKYHMLCTFIATDLFKLLLHDSRILNGNQVYA